MTHPTDLPPHAGLTVEQAALAVETNQDHPAPEAAPADTADAPGDLSDIVAALRAHEARDAEHRRRDEQAAMHARQRFD